MEQQPAASIFLALQESALGHAMRSSPVLYPAVEILHIIGFIVLVGSILALDLRLLGLARAIPIQPMAQLLLPMARVGFVLAVSMGFLLFSADASHVVRNPAFLSKLLLIGAALVNVVIAHLGPWRRLEQWGAEMPGGTEAPVAVKATALLSLLLWLGVVCAGRLIAYM
ncbi:MAG: hypothetical protein Q7J60_13870 [Bradyrhizobium sp.]|nr:hypothetical protein [Bradyrhizobium sp.]